MLLILKESSYGVQCDAILHFCCIWFGLKITKLCILQNPTPAKTCVVRVTLHHMTWHQANQLTLFLLTSVYLHAYVGICVYMYVIIFFNAGRLPQNESVARAARSGCRRTLSAGGAIGRVPPVLSASSVRKRLRRTVQGQDQRGGYGKGALRCHWFVRWSDLVA